MQELSEDEMSNTSNNTQRIPSTGIPWLCKEMKVSEFDLWLRTAIRLIIPGCICGATRLHTIPALRRLSKLTGNIYTAIS